MTTIGLFVFFVLVAGSTVARRSTEGRCPEFCKNGTSAMEVWLKAKCKRP
jgi:hypothetical protein